MSPRFPRRKTAWPPPGAAVGLLALSLAAGGCAIFDESVEALTPGGYDQSAADDPRLTGYRPVIEQIVLEVVLVERPADDPLLGRALWDSVGEVGVVEDRQAERLAEAGFRVGIASADPPEALRKLIDRSEPIGTPLPNVRLAGGPERDDDVIVKRVPLRVGGDAALHTGPTGRAFVIVSPPPAAGGEPRTESFADAVGAVRVASRNPHDRWVTFELTPEVHHGPVALRPKAGLAGMETAAGQRVRAWPDRACEVTVTVGDSVILGLRDDADPEGLAAGLLADERDGYPTDRLLVIRLADVRQVEGVKVER